MCRLLLPTFFLFLLRWFTDDKGGIEPDRCLRIPSLPAISVASLPQAQSHHLLLPDHVWEEDEKPLIDKAVERDDAPPHLCNSCSSFEIIIARLLSVRSSPSDPAPKRRCASSAS
ncbi:unnamed protein product [Linum trigynum]|uniref:Secreted protein n=1 Tax=Linum trigynum TaxID=586398 RepID=A0AAV2CLF3_9ROSI